MSQEENVRSVLTSSDVSNLPVRGRVGLVIEARDVATAINKIREAEQAGVQQVWMTQSVGMLDTLTLFAAVAAHTKQIRLGTSIVPIYPRHPLVMAQQAVTVDALAPGRLRLGVGTSHRHVMENMYGLSMSSPLAYLREYVEVMRHGRDELIIKGHSSRWLPLFHARLRFLYSFRHLARMHFAWPVKLPMARFRGYAPFPICSIKPYPLYEQELWTIIVLFRHW